MGSSHKAGPNDCSKAGILNSFTLGGKDLTASVPQGFLDPFILLGSFFPALVSREIQSVVSRKAYSIFSFS